MKVIMPMAGKGTRLLPLTKRVPKPLVNVAGRPVMDYVMEALKRAGTLDELIIITGHLKEKVEQYVRSHYDIPARFVERSEEHTSELQSLAYLVCRLLLEKKKTKNT